MSNFDPQEYWEQHWREIQNRRFISEKYSPKNHIFTLHYTYTGKGCAMCGKPEKGHMINAQH